MILELIHTLISWIDAPARISEKIDFLLKEPNAEIAVLAITVIIGFFTAIAGFRSARIGHRANNLKMLPLLMLFLRKKDENGSDTDPENMILRLRNSGLGSAYDLKFYNWHHFNINPMVHYLVKFNLIADGAPFLEGRGGDRKDEQTVRMQVFTDGKEEEEMAKVMTLLMNPSTSKGLDFSIPIEIIFRNAEGKLYYTKILTGSKPLTLVSPPKRINLLRFIILTFRWILFEMAIKSYKKITYENKSKTRKSICRHDERLFKIIGFLFKERRSPFYFLNPGAWEELWSL